MPLLIPIALGLIALFFYSKKDGDKGVVVHDVVVSRSNSMGLPDINPDDQGGSYSTQFDDTFDLVSKEKSVPFALLKAHAIRESSLKSAAYRQEPNGKASYGLMQILWWKGSNRFAQFGYSDDALGSEDSLYDPYINTVIAAAIIKQNWSRFDGNLRDTINAYNTGVDESTRIAPYGYVDDVLKYYKTLVGKDILL